MYNEDLWSLKDKWSNMKSKRSWWINYSHVIAGRVAYHVGHWGYSIEFVKHFGSDYTFESVYV